MNLRENLSERMSRVRLSGAHMRDRSQHSSAEGAAHLYAERDGDTLLVVAADHLDELAAAEDGGALLDSQLRRGVRDQPGGGRVRSTSGKN